MTNIDMRPEHLDWREVALQAANPDLPNLGISAQVHYGPPDRLAFINVFDVSPDRPVSTHDRLTMLRCLDAASCAGG